MRTSRIILFLTTVLCVGLAIPDDFVRNSDEFSISLYQELAKTQSGNFMLGSFPLQAMLALLSCGTKGETCSQIRSMLRFNTSDEVVAKEYQQVINELQRIPHFKVKLSNRLFINGGLEIEPSFLDTATGLSTLVEKFTLKSGKLRHSGRPHNDKMMNWLDEQHLIHQNNIALLNSIYVSGRWLQGFDKKLTKEMDFHLSPSKTVKVNMMRVTGYFMISRCPILGVKILKLPLQNERAQMLVAMTDDIEGLDSVLAPNALKLWNERHFNKEYITLYMPRFELTSDMDITPTLMKIGISKLFSAADLSGINEEITNVSLISQNIHLMVNERGISSINWPLMEDNIIEKQRNMSQKPPTVKLDHPFLFGILYDDMSLMFGRISNL